jgi:hypothetical protein
MQTTIDTFTAVRACAVALLAGVILKASDVTAGNGAVIDWRHVKSGEFMRQGADAFDTANMFVLLVGPDAAMGAIAALDGLEADKAPETERKPTRVTAYMQASNGGRRRSFEVGPFRVMIEPHEDDAAQEEFTRWLAALCDATPRGT